MAARLVPVNYFDSNHCSDLAVSPVAATLFPITNLQSNNRDKTWRSTSIGTSQVITGTFGGGARQISHLSIWPHREGTSSLIGATVAVRMWSDVAQTTLVRNAAAANFFTFSGENYNTFLWAIQSWGVDNADRTARLAPYQSWFTPVAVSAFEITIANAGAVDTSFFEGSRIWLGDYVEAPYQANYGAAPQWRSGSEHQRSISGALRRLVRARWRELRGEFVFLSEADRSAWFDLCYAADPGNEIILSLFQEGTKRDRDFTVMGSLEVLNPLVFENADFHTLQLAIVES